MTIGRKALVPLLLCGFLLAALLALAACGKEEKATPTKAAAAAAGAPATVAATKAPEATKPSAVVATQAPTSPTAAAINFDFLKGHSPKLAQYVRKYYVNDPNNYKPERDVPPKYGGEITGPFGTVGNWDVITNVGVSLASHALIVYGSFTRQLINRGEDLMFVKPKPDMMESWQQAGDGMSWTFKMRKGMKWQNRPPLNGRPVTIQDMKFGLDILRTESVRKPDFAEIQDTVVVDDNTLKVVLNKPFPDLPAMMMRNMIMAKECFESEECRKSKPVGSGPFMLESDQANVKVSLVKNPDYYGKDAQGNKLPFLDRVNTIQFADPAAQMAAMRTGKIDNIYLYGERDYLDLIKTNPDVVVGVVGPTVEYTMNATLMHLKYQEGKPWMDPRVRLAMSISINRQEMLDKAFDGIGVPAQPVPFMDLGAPFFLPASEMGEAWSYNPEKAKKLLADAGYPKGFKVKVSTFGTSGTAWNGLLIWQQMWKDVGIDMEIVQAPDSASYYGIMMKNQWEDLYYQTSMNMMWTRPFLAAYNTLHSKGLHNWSKISDPKLDELLDKARVTYDAAERAKVLRQVLDYEGQNPHMIYGVGPSRFDVASARVHRMGTGTHQAWGWGMDTLTETWVDPPR